MRALLLASVLMLSVVALAPTSLACPVTCVPVHSPCTLDQGCVPVPPVPVSGCTGISLNSPCRGEVVCVTESATPDARTACVDNAPL